MCVLLLPHVAEAVSTPVTLLRCYIITHTKLNAHVSWPRRTSTATQRSGELASLATGSQVDWHGGLIGRSQLAGSSVRPQAVFTPQEGNKLHRTPLSLYLAQLFF